MLDEMYPPALAAILRDQGHDVLAVAALPHLSGSPDETVLEVATSEARCLVTENAADFAVLARRTNHHGVLFVQAQRWPRSPAGTKRLADALGILLVTRRVPGPGEAGWLS
jgi:uncharacterized protein DUF5615